MNKIKEILLNLGKQKIEEVLYDKEILLEKIILLENELKRTTESYYRCRSSMFSFYDFLRENKDNPILPEKIEELFVYNLKNLAMEKEFIHWRMY